MGSPNKRVPKSPLKQWVLYQGGGCMYGNCCKQKIENNRKIKICYLKYTLTLRDQQTAMQPRQPQGSVKNIIK